MPEHRWCAARVKPGRVMMNIHRPLPSEVSSGPSRFRCLARALGALGALALSAAAVQAQVFVSSEKDHAIYRFSLEGEPQGSIPVCKRPRDMAFNPARTTIYVVCGDSNAIGIVDLASGRMTDTVPVGESPEMFGLSPDGRIAYVSIEDDNALGAYDLTTKKKLFDLKTGGEPEGVLITPDGKQAYVTSEVANVVHLFDLEGKKRIKDIKVGKRPRRFVLSSDGGSLWVSNELDGTVSRINRKTQTEAQRVKFEVKGMRAADITPVGMALSPDGKRLWVGLGRANHVAEVDTATGEVRNLVLVGKRAWGLAFSPDGKTLFVANGLSDDLTLVDAGSAKAIKTVPAGRVPHTVLIKP